VELVSERKKYMQYNYCSKITPKKDLIQNELGPFPISINL
jgi:hypothetical protein